MWLVIAALAIANGALRETALKQKLGESYAHLLSTLLLSALIICVAFSAIGWIGIYSIGAAWGLGFAWLGATLAFEFLAGHILFGNPWSKILADYNVPKGRVWILVPAVTLIAPPLAHKGINPVWAVPYCVSLIVATGVLFLAFSRPKICRWVIVALFGYAGCYNTWIGLTKPEEYLNFAKFVLIPWYESFILGSFAANAKVFIVGIASGQLLSAIALALGGSWLKIGVLGVCLFLLGIAPFGVGSALPFSFLVSLASVVLLGCDSRSK